MPTVDVIYRPGRLPHTTIVYLKHDTLLNRLRYSTSQRHLVQEDIQKSSTACHHIREGCGR